MSNDKDTMNMSDLTAALNEDDRAGLVNALKNKLQNLAGQHSDVLENLSPRVRKHVEYLREIQNQYDEMESKFFEERAALEAKYQKLYQPLYTKIVNGMVEVEGAPEEVKTERGEDKAAEGFTQSNAKISKDVNGEISVFDGSVTGMNLELEQGKLIVQKWRFGRWPDGHKPTVKIAFDEPEPGVTIVNLTHTDVPEEDRLVQFLKKTGWATSLWVFTYS